MLYGTLDAELNDVPLSKAPANFGQVQKAIVWHLLDSSGAKNKFEPNHATTPIDPTLAADWSPFLGASDETKPVPTPIITDVASEPGAERTYGGGNATPGGVKLILGNEPQDFMSKILATADDARIQASIKLLKTFMRGCGIGKTSIGIVLINEAGQILFDSNGLALDAVGLELYPIPIHGLNISDLGFGNYESVDYNNFSFQFPANWSDNLVVVTPADFDAFSLANS